MASTNDLHGASASPNSSEEVESHHGTPATKLSPFSPDDVPDNLKIAGHGIVRSKVPPAFVLTHAQSNFTPKGKAGHAVASAPQDPFITAPILSSTTRSSADTSKLSPIASSFTPASLLDSVSSAGKPNTVETALYTSTNNDDTKNLTFLAPPSASKASDNGTKTQDYVLPDSSNAGVLSQSLPKSFTWKEAVTHAGLLKLGQFSSDDGTSRSLMISQAARNTSAKEVDQFFNVGIPQHKWLSCH